MALLSYQGRTVITVKATLKEITKQRHLSLPNTTFFLLLFKLLFYHVVTVHTIYGKGALLLADPLYFQVAYVCVSGHYVECYVG